LLILFVVSLLRARVLLSLAFGSLDKLRAKRCITRPPELGSCAKPPECYGQCRWIDHSQYENRGESDEEAENDFSDSLLCISFLPYSIGGHVLEPSQREKDGSQNAGNDYSVPEEIRKHRVGALCRDHRLKAAEPISNKRLVGGCENTP
jgi:hypothetical protein